MEDARVCRICLVVGVKMHNLHSYPLNAYFEALIGINPLSVMELPPYGCYECTALMVKLYQFRERCLVGQSELCSVLQATGKITPETLNRIDRKRLKLTSNLAVQQNNMVYHINSEKDTVEIKLEVPKEKNVPDDILIEFDCVKEEDYGFDRFENHSEFPLAELSSDDDDEPLSLRKSEKELKKMEKRKEKGKNKKNVPVVEVSFDCNAELQAIESLTDIATFDAEAEMTEPPKRKRGRPRLTEVKDVEVKQKSRRTKNTGGVTADDIDLEEYVTIVQLTTEEQRHEITKRQQSSNYLNAPFQCNLCFKGFIDTHAWKHHVGKHDPSAGDVECPVCKFRFRSKRALQKHAANHEKKYACKSCPYISKTTTQAKQHQRWHKGVTYKCQYCDEVSTKWTSYLSHVRIKHPSEFICGVCGYSYVSKLGLAMHKTMMHKDLVEKTEDDGEKAAGPYCQDCDVQFVSVEAWKRHMVTSAKHAPANDFKIEVCLCRLPLQAKKERRNCCHTVQGYKECSQPLRALGGRAFDDNIQRCKEIAHRLYAESELDFQPHNNEELRMHGCRACGSVFASAEELRLHHRAEHARRRPKNYGKKRAGAWPAACPHCSEEIPNAREYWTHFRRVHPDKPYPIQKNYICDICGKSFRGNAFLVYHKRTHFEERAYKCAQCPKAFYNRHNLQMHEKTHSDARPYPCTLCFKAFKCKGALDRHFRSHTGVKPYECEVCGKAFGQSNSRKLHVRTVHLKQPAPYVSRARKRRPLE